MFILGLDLGLRALQAFFQVMSDPYQAKSCGIISRNIASYGLCGTTKLCQFLCTTTPWIKIPMVRRSICHLSYYASRHNRVLTISGCPATIGRLRLTSVSVIFWKCQVNCPLNLRNTTVHSFDPSVTPIGPVHLSPSWDLLQSVERLYNFKPGLSCARYFQTMVSYHIPDLLSSLQAYIKLKTRATDNPKAELESIIYRTLGKLNTSKHSFDHQSLHRADLSFYTLDLLQSAERPSQTFAITDMKRVYSRPYILLARRKHIDSSTTRHRAASSFCTFLAVRG
ncbi:hypothetical protein H2248_010387 [Termitomyces sp. 'cryptogamus']|nr:hypothetical protein H2248_010387 [Termitomyces sp. 'cryptogamus']